MYTVKDYITDIKEKAEALNAFLEKFDTRFVHAILNLIVRDDFLEAQQLTYDIEGENYFIDMKAKLTTAKVILPEDTLLEAKPYSKLAQVLCTYLYCQQHRTEDLTQEIETILLSFSELNPHRAELKQIYDHITAGDYDDYMLMLNSHTSCFIMYPNSILKVLYVAISVDDSKALLLNELKVALLADGEDIMGLRYLKAYYMPVDVTDKSKYCAILLYDGGTLYEADSRYHGDAYDSRYPEIAALNQQALDYYPENQNLKLGIDKNAMYIEPIYVGDANHEGVYLNVNYSYIATSIEQIKGGLLS